MDRPATPDAKSVADLRATIRSTSQKELDELLTELLVRTYPLRVSQSN